jgi:hypothetical protein
MGKSRQRARRREREARDRKASGQHVPPSTNDSSTTEAADHQPTVVGPSLPPPAQVTLSSPADEMQDAMSWLQDPAKVKAWLNGWDLVDQLESSEGLIRVMDFLPPFVARGILQAIKAIPKSRWDVREDQDDTKLNTTQHRFLVANSLDDYTLPPDGQVRTLCV